MYTRDCSNDFFSYNGTNTKTVSGKTCSNWKDVHDWYLKTYGRHTIVTIVAKGGNYCSEQGSSRLLHCWYFENGWYHMEQCEYDSKSLSQNCYTIKNIIVLF